MKTAKKPPGGQEIRHVFAYNLKRLRKQRNISQLELSGLTGLTHNFINDIESCKKWISSDTLAKFAAALHAQPFQFFLSEIPPDKIDGELLTVYNQDFADIFQRVVSDWMDTYLPKKTKKTDSPGDKAARKR
ncbi:MAG: helix-turn-helix domain-containing protein [Treponema sp.]|jgi:transcriptional regulator with XRE-family HTH domain|nr:helix-turn-helix domain-containing protein [Treponema sp.]